MNITLDTLRRLINEELQRRSLQEKQDERQDDPDIDDEERLSVAQALDVLENASHCSGDQDETKWYITKLGETFGLEPEEE
jgi:hypothetical protein|tara:strand:- start:493 stop:735 length:243 start_codon:yes stop_codon:yes gene_type:complete